MLIQNFILDFILNPWFLLSLIFWIMVGLAIVLLKNKKKAYSVFFPLLAIFRTRRLNKIITRISRKGPKFWRIFWNIGIFVSFGFTIYGFYFLFSNVISLIFTPKIENVIIPLIPGVTIELPIFFYLILPLLFIITTHEFSHGISASVDGVEIKSTGVLGVGIFYMVGFGAFVEVDERELNSTKFSSKTRLRIAAAGTYANAIVAGIGFLLLILFPYITAPWYVQVTSIYSVLEPTQGGFNHGNLQPGDAIIAIKKQGEPDHSYVYLDENKGINLGYILNNRSKIKCSIGDNLTFKVYNPNVDTFFERNVTLGPRYHLNISYVYVSNNELKITFNFTSNQETSIMITKINGTQINVSSGKTLEFFLTNFNLKALNFSTNGGKDYIVRAQVVGVFVGVQTTVFWMYKNDIAKFLTPFWPEFWLKEIMWLFVIGFSVALFNMLPIPAFDGDRIVKEIVNRIFGASYTKKKIKTDKFEYEGKNLECNLSEYRVEKVIQVKIYPTSDKKINENEFILLGEKNYELVDKIGDGFKDTVSITLPENTSIKPGTLFEVKYESLHDENKKHKKIVLTTIRVIATSLLLANFLLSFLKFGVNLFWM
ncbi:MAG: site-2 protease family protein [Promethearchaeota archaeon]